MTHTQRRQLRRDYRAVQVAHAEYLAARDAAIDAKLAMGVADAALKLAEWRAS